MDQRASHRIMPLAQLFQNRSDPAWISRFRLGGDLNQFASYAAHRRNNYHDMALAHRVPNDMGDFRDAGSVRDRGATKFHDAKRLLRVLAELRMDQAVLWASVRTGGVPGQRLSGSQGRIAIFQRSGHGRGARAVENSCRRLCWEYQAR